MNKKIKLLLHSISIFIAFMAFFSTEAFAASSIAVVMVSPHEFQQGHYKILTENAFEEVKGKSYKYKQGEKIQNQYREFCSKHQIPVAVEITPRAMTDFVKESGHDTVLFLFVDKPVRYSAAYLATKQQVNAVVAVPGFIRQQFKEFFGDSFFGGSFFGGSDRSQLAEYDRFLKQVCHNMDKTWQTLTRPESKGKQESPAPQQPEPKSKSKAPAKEEEMHGNPVQM